MIISLTPSKKRQGKRRGSLGDSQMLKLTLKIFIHGWAWTLLVCLLDRRHLTVKLNKTAWARETKLCSY